MMLSVFLIYWSDTQKPPLFSPTSDSISAPLNVHMLAIYYTNFTSSAESLAVILQVFYATVRAAVLSCLMGPAHIRTGNLVVCILGWIAQRKSGYVDHQHS